MELCQKHIFYKNIFQNPFHRLKKWESTDTARFVISGMFCLVFFHANKSKLFKYENCTLRGGETSWF